MQGFAFLWSELMLRGMSDGDLARKVSRQHSLLVFLVQLRFPRSSVTEPGTVSGKNG